jgi:hypothetical protein
LEIDIISMIEIMMTIGLQTISSVLEWLCLTTNEISYRY